MVLTACPSTAHSAVSRVIRITTNISHARIVQSLLAKLAPVHVLNTPKASRRDGGGLCAFGHVHRLGGGGGHGCKRAEELCEKGHKEVEEKGEEQVVELQIGRGSWRGRYLLDLGAIVLMGTVFMGRVVERRDPRGSMMPSFSDKSRGGG